MWKERFSDNDLSPEYSEPRYRELVFNQAMGLEDDKLFACSTQAHLVHLYDAITNDRIGLAVDEVKILPIENELAVFARNVDNIRQYLDQGRTLKVLFANAGEASSPNARAMLTVHETHPDQFEVRVLPESDQSIQERFMVAGNAYRFQSEPGQGNAICTFDGDAKDNLNRQFDVLFERAEPLEYEASQQQAPEAPV